jgi:DNA-binding CsgD family transcriptional regulator
MREYSVDELLETRGDCRVPGCANELEHDAPTRGRYSNMCKPCQRGATIASRLYFSTLRDGGGRRFAEHEPLELPDADFGALSPREEAVLFAIADGLRDADIAEELEIALDTVKAHVKHLLGKLGARNRAHAVALAYHHGLLIPRGGGE